jgi:hypothetical protein
MDGRESEIAFPLLGRPFRARGMPARLASWLREHWHFPEHAVPPHPYDVSLTRIAAPPRWEAAAPRHVRLHGGRELAWWVEGAEDAECWWTGTEEVGLRLELGAAGSRIELWGAGVGGADLHAALYLALCESLRASGLLPLHAAVVVRDGRATALCGPSGVGKSTTLLTALHAGWTPLAEDLSWLDPASLTLHGWDRGVRLWPEGRDRLPAYAAASWDTDATGSSSSPIIAFPPRCSGARRSRACSPCTATQPAPPPSSPSPPATRCGCSGRAPACPSPPRAATRRHAASRS